MCNATPISLIEAVRHFSDLDVCHSLDAGNSGRNARGSIGLGDVQLVANHADDEVTVSVTEPVPASQNHRSVSHPRIEHFLAQRCVIAGIVEVA